MKHRILLPLGFAIALLGALPASAGCYADYKAKQDNPLRLHYGVIELPDQACANRKSASKEIDKRISRGGWQLLNVMSIFDASGLGERKQSAGQFYLRY